MGTDGGAVAATVGASGAVAVGGSAGGALAAVHGSDDGIALMEAAARRFGRQGEGAIEGTYLDYARPALNAHGVGGRFDRFTCVPLVESSLS